VRVEGPEGAALGRARDVAVGVGVLCDGLTVEVNALEDPGPRLAQVKALLGHAAAEHDEDVIAWTTDPPTYIGGISALVAFASRAARTGRPPTPLTAMAPDGYTPGHGMDYDVVCVGGGSGGLAFASEAAKLGVRVALLDFVKPTPHGTKWGLGGCCVCVGCIPKKLMHTAALLGEALEDAPDFGWAATGPRPANDWAVLREHVQDHIRSLNFGYRVKMREDGVTYLNKLGRFTGPNELECTDKKGRTSTIRAPRFVVAVGGRPTPLSCPGGELAISSDDLFSLEASPGRTCVVGAGYVALECAGFLAGLGLEVTVLVRSVPLRAFDRDCADRVAAHLESRGVRILRGVQPASIERSAASGALAVAFTDGGRGEFDTVLAAIGRTADTAQLGLGALPGVEVNASNGKVAAPVGEQTGAPHVYAIGDVVDGRPELTPVAIQAGRLLARRLFAGETAAMDYHLVPTTVFTPLEMGTVGLSEDEALARFGEDGVDVYLSEFAALEWSLSERRKDHPAYAKVVVRRGGGAEDGRVLGLHFVGPSAGEVIQGFAVALRLGATIADLQDTVGIHPTIAEEFTLLKVTRRSGESAAKTAC